MTNKQLISLIAFTAYVIACLLISSIDWRAGLAMFMLYVFYAGDRLTHG